MGTNPLLTFDLMAPKGFHHQTPMDGDDPGFCRGSARNYPRFLGVRTLSFSMGDIYIFLGNLCWALYGVLGRRFLKRSSSLVTHHLHDDQRGFLPNGCILFCTQPRIHNPNPYH